MKLLGIEVRDADAPVMLRIRAADTKTGTKDPNNCAAAKAAKRLPGVSEARIYRSRAYLLHKSPEGKFWKRYITPASIRNEIISFDRGSYFDPGEYTLLPLPTSQKLGMVRTHHHTGKGSKSHRSVPHVVSGIRARGPSGTAK